MDKWLTNSGQDDLDRGVASDVKQIAVIGAGISGLAAGYLLSRRHHVTLYERDQRLGGHTHTVVAPGDAGPVALDTGFLVHNPQTYPNLVRLFAEIGVATDASDMSFSVSCPVSGFEYSSRGLAGFFAQPKRLASPAHYRLLRDIVRFNNESPAILDATGAEGWTVGDYLRERQHGAHFASHYLAPMASAIWSASVAGIHRFPVQTLVRFMQNHGMLSVGSHPAWRVVRGGSHTYIPRLTAPIRGAVVTGARLLSVRRSTEGVWLTFADRAPQRVDDVVFACHGDQVLPLLADATEAEREVFRHFTTTANATVLHTDARVLPAAPRAHASWNYRLGAAPEMPPSVTYDLTRLQGIPGPTRYFVTLNPRTHLAEDRVIGRFEYRHPQFTLAAVAAQARWREVSGVRGTHFCGAYWRYGFHEDGLTSAIRVAHDLQVSW